ncbi:MAG TPA: hypothetical protein VND66_09510 [Acidobacteriaceae bacterium]|nr:hypothetical protein [Acidobacteriaceae bacterium]
MRIIFGALCLLLLLLPTSRAAAAQSSTPSVLPDAPSPVVSSAKSAPAMQTSGSSAGAKRYAPLYARTIFPGQLAQRLTVRDKFIYSFRQMVEPVNLVPAIFSSAESQWRNSDPKYGTDSGAFGQRLGAALIREDSDRLFTNAVLPSLLHEDPRYYRLGEGSTMTRAEYAVEQVFVGRTDGGKRIPNYAGLIGRGMAEGLTQAYYPDTSRGGGVVLRGVATSLGGLAAFDIMREFVPKAVFTHLTIFGHSSTTKSAQAGD